MDEQHQQNCQNPLMFDSEAVADAFMAANERIVEMGQQMQRVGLIVRHRL